MASGVISVHEPLPGKHHEAVIVVPVNLRRRTSFQNILDGKTVKFIRSPKALDDGSVQAIDIDPSASCPRWLRLLLQKVLQVWWCGRHLVLNDPLVRDVDNLHGAWLKWLYIVLGRYVIFEAGSDGRWRRNCGLTS